MAKSKKHPGFKGAASQVAKKTNPKTGKPYGKESANRIIGANKANASAAARKRNPRLNKKGGRKK